MNAILLVTALLAIPAGFLIGIGDEVDAIEEAQRIAKKSAKKSDSLKKTRVIRWENQRANSRP